MKNYSIFVNTCDSFEDCWDPFFILFKKFWSDYDGTIYLNTEYKDYSFKGLNIVPLKVCERHNVPETTRATWSQCLKWAWEAIDTPLVLYMQEDYFLKRPVMNEEVNRHADYMMQHDNVHRVFLLSSDSEGRPSAKHPYYVADRTKQYYVHTQASLWRREGFITLIDESESGWGFEDFATRRARFMPYNYYNVTNRMESPIMEYVLTGIVKGRWYPECVDLFKSNDINIDFSKRGFTTDYMPPKPFMKRVEYRLGMIWKLCTQHYPLVVYLYFKYYNQRKNCE